MGLPDSVDITPESLAQVYDAWCNSMSFDNVQKRVYFGEEHSGPLPGIEPTEFLTNFVEHGPGGTCWVTSGGLWATLDRLGFDARRVSGNMVGVGDFDEPNHGSVAVVPDGIRTIGRGKLITIDANANANVIVDDLTPDGQREALVTTFGLSEEIADRLPPDSTEGLALG